MTTQNLESFLVALQQGREFIPIQVSSLRLDTITGFDLYIQAQPGEPAVLYADHTVPFNETSRKRLEENQVQFLYVHSDQLDEYREYIETNMADILNDAGIRLEEKSDLLHLTSQGIVQGALDGRDLKQSIERGSKLVEHTVDFLFGHRSALRHLIESASVDYEIYSHSVNVCVMSLSLGHRMGFSADKLIDFGMGTLFRDIGVIKLDQNIVQSPNKLTVEEFEQIKRHPGLTVELLKNCGVNQEITLDVALHHHEKLDGSGYPEGLTAPEITPFSRICTVIDIFDALTTNRKHRAAIGTYEALKLMTSEMRGEIDIDIMKSFITMMGFSK